MFLIKKVEFSKCPGYEEIKINIEDACNIMLMAEAEYIAFVIW